MTTPANPALEPCPFCGSENVTYDDTNDFVYCCECTAEGPRCGSSKLSITAWNCGVLRERLKALEKDNQALMYRVTEMLSPKSESGLVRDLTDEANFQMKRAEAAEARVAELEKAFGDGEGVIAVADIKTTLSREYLRGRDDGVRIGFEKAREYQGPLQVVTYRNVDAVLAELKKGSSK